MSIFKKCIECEKFVELYLFTAKTNCCKACKATYNKVYRLKHKERLSNSRVKYSKEYYKNNKSRLKPIRKAWKNNNLDKSAAYRAKRRAQQLNATPSWSDEKLINSMYYLASFLSKTTFGEGYHVDHKVPLISDSVCGLHTEENLQILRANENLSKGNSIWPDMW